MTQHHIPTLPAAEPSRDATSARRAVELLETLSDIQRDIARLGRRIAAAAATASEMRIGPPFMRVRRPS